MGSPHNPYINSYNGNKWVVGQIWGVSIFVNNFYHLVDSLPVYSAGGKHSANYAPPPVCVCITVYSEIQRTEMLRRHTAQTHWDSLALHKALSLFYMGKSIQHITGSMPSIFV